MQGRQISYGVKVHLRRGSDRAERIYVAVTALQNAGLTNYEACCEVAGRWETKLGGSRRGRPRASSGSRQFADKVDTVRSIYNSFRLRHPWKESLPEHDPVYDQWWSRFCLFQQWVGDLILSAINRGLSGDELAEELALRRGHGGQLNYQALTELGEDGLSACLSTLLSRETEPQLTRSEAHRFAKEFLNWRASKIEMNIWPGPSSNDALRRK